MKGIQCVSVNIENNTWFVGSHQGRFEGRQPPLSRTVSLNGPLWGRGADAIFRPLSKVAQVKRQVILQFWMQRMSDRRPSLMLRAHDGDAGPQVRPPPLTVSVKKSKLTLLNANRSCAENRRKDVMVFHARLHANKRVEGGTGRATDGFCPVAGVGEGWRISRSRGERHRRRNKSIVLAVLTPRQPHSICTFQLNILI